VTTRAWPYAVTRSVTSGYQAIVAPGFLADAGLAYVLEYASRQETPESDAVTVREVLGATHEPLSLAYRVLEARADRYGLGGEEVLEDGAGRAIRIFEGLVLRLPAERVSSIGLTGADLDAVIAVTAPAFRKLWAAEGRIEPEAAPALSVGGTASDARPLNLQIAQPYVVPGSGVRPVGRRTLSIPRAADDRSAAPGEPRPRRTRLITAIAFVCVLAAVLAWFLTRPSPASAQATVQQLCSDLERGDTTAAYQQFSDTYHRATSLRAFESSLLGSSASGSCRAMTVADDHATVSLQPADSTIRTVTLDMQSEAGQWQITSMKVSP
jgi:hypothetical protein